MDAMPQLPFELDDLFLNPERRCPCLLLLDTSYSMSGSKIDQLNAGIQMLRNDLLSDTVAAKRVELAMVTFGPVRTVQSFATIDRCTMPRLDVDNDTPMGEAITTGLTLLDDRKANYRASGVPYFRPWVFLITDGAATDNLDAARKAIAAGEKADQFCFFAIGVDTADMNELAGLSVRQPLMLKGLQFEKLFLWLSGSLRDGSRSTPKAPFTPDNPLAADGWAELPR